MSPCSTHISTAPPAPRRPHDPSTGRLRCFICRVRLASDQGRLAHHCTCCGERLSTCRDTEGRYFAVCTNCPANSEGSAPSRDPLADLLRGDHEPDGWARMLASARTSFGDLVVGYLVQVFHRSGSHTYARLSVDAHRLDLRFAGHFEAAVSAPCGECSTGRVWTPVRTVDDLLLVHLHGGTSGDAQPCDHPERRQYGVGPERTSTDHMRL